ncbi:DUF3325 domain-containing protein [Variovorax sp. LT1P1]|uniref:DUF3325 domain-containing protein n=1 Tax=Variovorax sp. LT1P1 TaxID=3443730 RepID=UPI003F486B31
MSPSTAVLLSLTCAFVGMAALAGAMDRHHEQMVGRAAVPPMRRRALQALGCVLLGISLGCCIAAWGASVGPIAWWGLLTLGAGGVVLLLSALGRRTPRR